MTARQVFEATLIELSKIQAPSLKLYEFNYLFEHLLHFPLRNWLIVREKGGFPG